MKENPLRETKRLLEFIDLKSIQDKAIREIVVRTSFDSVKGRSKSGHFRAGRVDAYHAYFNEKMMLDIKETEKNNRIKKKFYFGR